MLTLTRFLLLVLHVTPRLLWWALGGLFLGILNLVLLSEVWPSTRGAEPLFKTLIIGCLLLLPWLGARVAWLLADQIESFFWSALWRLAAVGAYAVAGLMSVVMCIGLFLGL